MLEGWDSIADGFGGLRWHGGADCGAHFVQRGAGGFGDAGKIFVDVLRSALWFLGLRFRGKGAFVRLRLFHAAMLAGRVDE